MASMYDNIYGKDSHKARRFNKRLAKGNIKTKDLRRLGEQQAAYNIAQNIGTVTGTTNYTGLTNR